MRKRACTVAWSDKAGRLPLETAQGRPILTRKLLDKVTTSARAMLPKPIQKPTIVHTQLAVWLEQTRLLHLSLSLSLSLTHTWVVFDVTSFKCVYSMTVFIGPEVTPPLSLSLRDAHLGS